MRFTAAATLMLSGAAAPVMPVVVRGRRSEPDEIEAGLERRQAQFLVFLRRQIDDDEPVDTRAPGISEEALDAIDVDRIVVAHEHDRRRIVAAAKVADERERALHVLAGRERAQAGGLDRRPIGRRVGERHAQFDHVGARPRQRLEDRE
jgi:hypothetical protein